MTDPIADMLTRIRNAKARSHEIVDIPKSGTKSEIVKILKQEGLIVDYKTIGISPKHMIRVALKYISGVSVISELKRVSTPGRRMYIKHDAIRPVKHGTGIAILSTSKGLLTDRQAKHAHVGGEVLCYIW